MLELNTIRLPEASGRWAIQSKLAKVPNFISGTQLLKLDIIVFRRNIKVNPKVVNYYNVTTTKYKSERIHPNFSVKIRWDLD